jgi:hypothetical protein
MGSGSATAGRAIRRVPCGYRGLPRLSAGALDLRPRGCRYDATIVADATLPPIRLGDLHGCDTQEKSEGTNKSGPSTLAHGTPRCACVRAAKITHSAQGRLETRTRSEINGIARLTHWFADATNGIGEMFARVFKGERVETQELCVGDVCVTRDQFAECSEVVRWEPPAPQRILNPRRRAALPRRLQPTTWTPQPLPQRHHLVHACTLEVVKIVERAADGGAASKATCQRHTGFQHAKEDRRQETEVQKLRRKRHSEEGRQSCSLSKVRRHRHQAVTRTHNENAPWHEATGRNSFDD